ncbi:MAG: sulfite reductase, partial [Gallionellales bacterium CG_4_9_14_0_8_um_filter_55_61]
KIIGKSFKFGQIPEVIARLLQVYVDERFDDERFIDTVRRLGFEPFKAYVYATPVEDDAELAGPIYDLLKQGTPYELPYYSPRF